MGSEGGDVRMSSSGMHSDDIGAPRIKIQSWTMPRFMLVSVSPLFYFLLLLIVVCAF